MPFAVLCDFLCDSLRLKKALLIQPQETDINSPGTLKWVQCSFHILNAMPWPLPNLDSESSSILPQRASAISSDLISISIRQVLVEQPFHYFWIVICRCTVSHSCVMASLEELNSYQT